jgi:dihydroneopterin aldolase
METNWPHHQTIDVTDVPCALHLGVSEAERAKVQTILVSATLTLADPPSFTQGADLEHTVDYGDLIGFIRDGIPARGPIKLVETVADAVAEFALASLDRVRHVAVTVKKPSVLSHPGMVAVTMRRTK